MMTQPGHSLEFRLSDRIRQNVILIDANSIYLRSIESTVRGFVAQS
jgi:hypothetical protein